MTSSRKRFAQATLLLAILMLAAPNAALAVDHRARVEEELDAEEESEDEDDEAGA